MSKKEMGGRRRRRLSELGLPSLLSSLPRSASASPSPLPFCRKLKSNFCFPLSLFSFHRLPPSVASPLFPPWLAASAGGDGSVISRRQQQGVDTRQTHTSSSIRGARRRTVGSLVLCLLLFGAFKSSCVAFPNFSPREAWFLWAVWMYRSGDLKGFSTKLMFESVSPWLNVGDSAAAFEYDKGRQ